MFEFKFNGQPVVVGDGVSIFRSVYSNVSASGLFISAVHSRYDLPHKPNTLRNVLTCLRNVHKDQSGALLVLLVDKLLVNSLTGVGRICESLACRRIEVLIAEEQQVHILLFHRCI